MTNQRPDRQRASRYKIPNNERILISCQNERLAGTLHVLSTTGGLVQLSKRFPAGTLAEIKLETVSGPVTSVVEMLPVRAGRQPFKFIHQDDASKKRLASALKALRAQGLGDKADAPVDSLIRFAKRLLPTKR